MLVHNEDSPLLITAVIAQNEVARILVDCGSGVDILYADTLELMELPDKTLRPYNRLLHGFANEKVTPEGRIYLPVTVGTAPRQATVFSDFVVMVCKGPSPYNAIIGRPIIHRLRAVPSTYYQVMKFPTSLGVGMVRGD